MEEQTEHDRERDFTPEELAIIEKIRELHEQTYGKPGGEACGTEPEM